MKQVSSPFTTRYFGCVTYEGSLMILMDFCDHGSLRDLLDYREQPLTEPQIYYILKDVIGALSILHTKYKTIHRDIKAANILLNSKAEIKVTDFGVSRKFGNLDQMVTISQVGSPYWVAPEIIKQQQYSTPADIYSLGATVVELAEGFPPLFEKDVGFAMAEVSSIGSPGLREPGKVSKELHDLITACLSYDPNKRPTIAQLFKHPFFSKPNNISREEALRPLIECTLNFDKLVKEDNPEEEDENSGDFIK